MSYNLPGQDPGLRTNAPTTPCEGDFFEELHTCQEHGWFLWVGAFCVLVVICAMCSCFVVTPACRLYRRLIGADDDGQRPKGVTVRQEMQHHGRQGGGGRAANDDAGGNKPIHSQSYERRHWYLSNLPRISPEDEMRFGPRRSPAFTVTTTPTTPAKVMGRASQSRRHQVTFPQQQRQQRRPQERRASFTSSRRSSMSSRRELLGRSVLSTARRGNNNNHNRRHGHSNSSTMTRAAAGSTAAAVENEKGIGAEATLRGGGWMGATNGRF